MPFAVHHIGVCEQMDRVTLGCVAVPVPEPGRHAKSTDWTVIAVDLPNNLLDVTIYHEELDTEYFVIGDTAHTPLEIEVAPMTIKGIITCLILLACCPQPPFYLVEGQILAQAIPIPAEVPIDGKSPEVYRAKVVGEEKLSLACNLTHGSDHLHVEGVLDTGADVTIIPEKMWPSHWELQPVVGKIQGSYYQSRSPNEVLPLEGTSARDEVQSLHMPVEDKVQRMRPWKYLGLEITARTIVPTKLELHYNPKTLEDLHSFCGSLNRARPWLGLTNEDLDPFFNLLKGEKELVSPRELTPEAKAAIKKAKLSHQQYHQNVPGLIHQIRLTRSQARAIVATCPSCQLQAMPSLGAGVNPRGLGSCEVWQTDITHIPSFGHLKYVHVSIDTYSEKTYLPLNPVRNPTQVVFLLTLNSLAAAWIIPQPRQNIWVTLAHMLQQENICLSTAAAKDPMSTCLVGIPLQAVEYPARFDTHMPNEVPESHSIPPHKNCQH
ncbi:hypothetical protein TURU_008413 [Turdus rufiventris]|nr:hypothetical protein TURU_008413 [Turdus rufiventris]